MGCHYFAGAAGHGNPSVQIRRRGGGDFRFQISDLRFAQPLHPISHLRSPISQTATDPDGHTEIL